MVSREITLWEEVSQEAELLQLIETSDPSDVSVITSLRKKWSKECIAVAIEYYDAQKRAIRKGFAHSFITDRQGIEQATSLRVAEHKANRFANHFTIYDCCCGVGGDLIALPSQTIGIDVDELRCWMATKNTGKTVQQTDVTSVSFDPSALIHIDPARRTNTKRVFALSGMMPPLENVFDIASQVDGGCIKCSPAVNPEDFEQLQVPIEIEYIEEHRTLVQAAVWFGSLANHSGQSTSTIIDLQTSISGSAEEALAIAPIGAYLYEPKQSLERANLHHVLGLEFNAHELARGLGILSSSKEHHTEWFNIFEVIEVLPMRLEKVQTCLDGLDCKHLEVKTRGQVVDPNEWQNKLNVKSSGETLTIFALRVGKQHQAIVTRRIQQS